MTIPQVLLIVIVIIPLALAVTNRLRVDVAALIIASALGIAQFAGLGMLGDAGLGNVGVAGFGTFVAVSAGE